MNTRCCLVFCLAMGLGACVAGPDFKRPDAPDASSYTGADDSALTGAQRVVPGASIRGNWWTLFKSPTLDDVINQALSGNPSLAAARLRVAQAQEEVNAAQGGLAPQLTLDATAGRQKYGQALFGPSGFTIPPFTYYTVGPSLSFPLDLFGGTRRTIEEQKALADYQQYEWRAAYLSLTADVVAQSLTLAAEKAQITAVGGIVADDARIVNLVETAFKAGAVTKIDLLTAQSQLTADRTLLPPLEQQRSVTRHALAILTGRTPARWSPPRFALDQFTLPHELPVSLPSELVHQRPDILAAEAQLHAASAAIGVATANMYPNISITATLTQQALTPGHLFTAAANAWGFAANLTQPLFDGGALKAKRRAAVDAWRASFATYQQTVLAAFGQVADNLQALVHDSELLNAQRQAVKTARNAFTLARLSYSGGNTGILQAVDSKRLYAQAQLGEIHAQAQRYLDTAQLFLSLGGTPPGAAAAHYAQ